MCEMVVVVVVEERREESKLGLGLAELSFEGFAMRSRFTTTTCCLKRSANKDAQEETYSVVFLFFNYDEKRQIENGDESASVDALEQEITSRKARNRQQRD